MGGKQFNTHSTYTSSKINQHFTKRKFINFISLRVNDLLIIYQNLITYLIKFNESKLIQ